MLQELSKPPIAPPDGTEPLAPVEKPVRTRHRRYYDCGCLATIARLMLWANRNNRR